MEKHVKIDNQKLGEWFEKNPDVLTNLLKESNNYPRDINDPDDGEDIFITLEKLKKQIENKQEIIIEEQKK